MIKQFCLLLCYTVSTQCFIIAGSYFRFTLLVLGYNNNMMFVNQDVMCLRDICTQLLKMYEFVNVSTQQNQQNTILKHYS